MIEINNLTADLIDEEFLDAIGLDTLLSSQGEPATVKKTLKKQEINRESYLGSIGSDSSNDEWSAYNSTFASSRNSVAGYLFIYGIPKGSTSSELLIRNIHVSKSEYPKLVLKRIVNEQSGDHELIPSIFTIKVTPTKYLVDVKGAKEPYTLGFKESYQKLWRVYEYTPDTNFFTPFFEGNLIAEDNHYMANGFSNSWDISPSDLGGKEDYTLVVEFLPQKVLFI